MSCTCLKHHLTGIIVGLCCMGFIWMAEGCGRNTSSMKESNATTVEANGSVTEQTAEPGRTTTPELTVFVEPSQPTVTPEPSIDEIAGVDTEEHGFDENGILTGDELPREVLDGEHPSAQNDNYNRFASSLFSWSQRYFYFSDGTLAEIQTGIFDDRGYMIKILENIVYPREEDEIVTLQYDQAERTVRYDGGMEGVAFGIDGLPEKSILQNGGSTWFEKYSDNEMIEYYDYGGFNIYQFSEDDIVIRVSNYDENGYLFSYVEYMYEHYYALEDWERDNAEQIDLESREDELTELNETEYVSEQAEETEEQYTEYTPYYLSEDDAIEIAGEYWGTYPGAIDPETGNQMSIISTGEEIYNGRMCYKVVLRWFVLGNYPTLDWIYIDTETGECYRAY